MRIETKSMSSDLMDRTLPHRGPDPEELAARNERTPENAQAVDFAEKRAHMREKLRLLIDDELRELSYSQKGDLAAFWTDDKDWLYPRLLVAERLHLGDSAVGVAKCKALSAHPCGPIAGKCFGTPGCAHSRGRDIWEGIARRVASKLRDFEE